MGRLNLKGQAFGVWSIVSAAPDVDGVTFWSVECECGHQFVKSTKDIRRKMTYPEFCSECEYTIKKANSDSNHRPYSSYAVTQ